MIDSHSHLDYFDDPEQAVNGLRACITVGTSVERNETALELAERLSNVWAAVGIHPNDASASDAESVRLEVERQATHEKVVAIGETGFDTHWDRETLDSQARAFDWQAQLARRLNLPLILHVRDAQGREDASQAAAQALRRAGHDMGVLHCFNGNRDLLETALDLGWFVSFAGNLTYPSAKALREIATEIPEDRLLVETDAPFLAPVPHRGKSNTPRFVEHTLARLSETRGVSTRYLEEVTDANAIRFYRLPLELD